MRPNFNRRQLMRSGVAAGAAICAARLDGQSASGQTETASRTPTAPADQSFRYCLNTSTIRGQGLSLDAEIEIAGQAGYEGIEPWIREIQTYTDKGGSLRDLRKRLDDHGLVVEGAIGFANWIVDDPQKRASGLETARRDMDLVRQLGGRRIAAPPAGATRTAGVRLTDVANRYRDLLQLGEEMDVTPQLEMWGSSQTLGRLSELAYVGVQCGHSDVGFLPDVYHIYRGGSDFHGLGLLNGRRIHVFHMNDYPASPERTKLVDSDRVYPGDGVAPFQLILEMLQENGFAGCLSLELFNREYWKQDALQVARTGIEKMRETVARHVTG